MKELANQLESIGNEIDKAYPTDGPDRQFVEWFYPARNGVKGFLGTQDIFFVGEHPTFSDKFAGPVERFYQNLKECGFENAHITDLIKKRMSSKHFIESGSYTTYFDEINKQWLLQEILALKPRLLVAIGKTRVYQTLQEFVQEKQIPTKVDWVYHYSYRFVKSETRNEQFNKVGRIYKQL